jgi:deoxyhypusine synthase
MAIPGLYAAAMSELRAFLDRHFTNFNARELVAAAGGYREHIDAGGKMMVTLAGAMSTAGIGRSLAPMIRAGKVHAITCTGANLEEDVFLLLAGDTYERVADWRALSAADEAALYDRGMNRVTDTCIPEDVMRHVEGRMIDLWTQMRDRGERMLPAELFWHVLDDPQVQQHFQRDPADSWLLAAKRAGIPVWTPGWEDSTLGNIFTAWCIREGVEDHRVVRFGTEAMQDLAHWYRGACGLAPAARAGEAPAEPQAAATEGGVGFFQIGGGIAGDFPICVVPMMIQDLRWDDTPFWSYFCQISDATTSYGGYSGAVPNEKITWGKLTADTPRFMIQSDASIVAPLIFGYVMGQ